MRRLFPCKAWLATVILMAWVGAPRGEAQDIKLEAHWQDLATKDSEAAYRAIWALVLRPDQTIPFLQAQLRPVSGDRKQIDQLVRDLDSGSFAAREKAAAELEKLADGAEEALRDALKGNPGIEMKRRIESLLAKLPDPAGTPERVRQLRALEVLEAIGTKEAEALLRHLATGNKSAHWTQVAQESRARVAARLRPSPLPEPAKVDHFGDPLPPGILTRLGTVRMQGGSLAALTSDGKMLVGVSAKCLHLWDTTTGREVPGFPQVKNRQFISAIAVSPNGNLVGVAYDFAHSFDIVEIPCGRLVLQQRGTWRQNPNYCTAAFSADSKTFMIAKQTDLAFWDVAEAKKTRDFADPDGFHYVAGISQDGKFLATTVKDTIRIRNIATGEIVRELTGHKGLVDRAVFSRDGFRLAAMSDHRGSLHVWDIADGKIIIELHSQRDPSHSGPVWSFALSPDGKTFAIVACLAKDSPKQQIMLRNLADPDAKPRVFQPPPGIGWIEGISHDGKWLLYRNGNAFRLLDIETGKDRHEWPYRGAITAVAYSADNSRIATGCSDGTVSIWDAASAKLLRTVIGNRTGVGSVAFSPDSRLLVACGGYKEPAIVWDAISGEKKFEVDNNRTTIPGVYWTGFSADSKFLYTGGHSIYRGIFETATGKLHGQFETNRQSTWHMGFSADGRFVASGIDSFCVYDLAARKIRHTFPSSQTVAHAISVDGRTVAVLNNAHDNPAVVLWDVLTGRERARFPLPKGYFPSGRLCFSPDGRMLAATTPSYASDSLHVWDLATRNELGPFPGHLDSITAVAFSPDSRRMATASGDGTVLIREIIPEARR